MKQRLLYSCVWAILCVGLLSGGRLHAQNIIGPTNSAQCVVAGGGIITSFTATGSFNVNNVFNVELSTANGTFPATPTIIATRTASPSSAVTYQLLGTMPSTLAAGAYKMRVVSTNPVLNSTTVNIGISPAAPPAGISSPAGQICAGSPVSMTATGSTLKWFDQSGGLVQNNSATYNFTAPGAGTYTYTVTQLVGLCESPGRTITFTVTAKSPDPVLPPSQPLYCSTIPGAALNATGTNLRWYGTNSNNPSPAIVPTVPSTNVAGSIGPFYVSQNTTGCESTRIGIPVTVNNTPSAPSVTNPQNLCQSPTPQILSPSGAGFRWYSSAGALLPNNGAAPTQNLSTPTSVTYQVGAVANGCESTQRSPVVVNVSAAPSALASVSLTYCQSAAPSALTVNGTNVRWYSDAAGTTQITQPAPPTTPNTYTYYVRQFTGNCGSSPSSYVVRVSATPATPTVTPENRCLNETPRQLTVSGIVQSASVVWFDQSGAGLPSAPSPPTSATGTLSYQVQQTNTDGCTSQRATATVTINNIPTAPAVVLPAAFCEGKAAPTLSATGSNLRWYGTSATGGTFTGTPPSVNNTFVGTTTFYVAQFANGCEGPRAAIPVVVRDTPDAPGVSGLAFCLNQPAPTLTASSVPGATLIWSTGPSGATQTTPPTVPNNVAQLLTYTVFQRLNGCDGPTATLPVNVKGLPTAPSVTPMSLCQNGSTRPIQASGTLLRYYDPSGNGGSTAPTPPTNSVGTFTYQVSQTQNDCEGPRAPLVVTVNALPSAPGVNDLFFCLPQADQPAQAVQPLSAQGQNLRWYNIDGNAFSSTPTPPIDRLQTIQYQVSQTVNNCEGPRSTLNVTVRTAPAPVVSVTSVSYCRNDQTTPLQATGEAGGSLRWLDPNGNLTNNAPSPITLNATAPGGRIFYVYQIGANGCYSARSSIRLFVNTNPTLSLLGSTTVNLGRTAPLQLRFTGVPPFGYTLSDGTAGTTNDTLTTVNVMPPQTTVFQVASVTNVCGQGLPGNPATATVFVRIPTITTGTLPASVACAGTGFSVPFTTNGEFNAGNIFRVEIATDSTSRVSTTVGVGNGQVGPISVSIPASISAGLYYLRVVGSNPGIAVLGKPSPVFLNIRPLPSAILVGTQDVFEGQAAKLNITFTGDGPWTFAYADSLRSLTVATNANPHVLDIRPLRNTTYKLTSVVNNCGFGPVSGTAVVRVLPVLGVEDDLLGQAVNAYPVPTTSILTVDIDLPLNHTNAGLTVTDLNGRAILQRKTRDKQIMLDLTNQPTGIYLLRVQVGDKQTTRRILKQ